MENKQKINLIKQRDFSETFDVSFAFLKQNIGSILRGLVFSLPIIMVGLFLMQSGQSEFMESYANLGAMSDPTEIWSLYAKMFTPIAIIGYIFLFLGGMIMALYPLCYVILYVRSENGNISQSEVWNLVKKVFLPLTVCHIIFGFILNLGFLLCIIPGIIVGIYLAFFPYTYAAENSSITECFSRSAKLVKGNWWITFLIVLITIFLLAIIYMITAIPSFMTGFAGALGLSAFSNPIAVYITSLIPYLGSLFTTPFFVIIIGAMYYSRIAETGTEPMEQFIENIGTKDNQSL